MEADIIILQTPVNWFGAPWIYKKYVDEVFNSGLYSQKFLTGDGRTRKDPTKQYGSGGKLQGKKFMICATWNAPAEAFDNPDQSMRLILLRSKRARTALLPDLVGAPSKGFAVGLPTTNAERDHAIGATITLLQKTMMEAPTRKRRRQRRAHPRKRRRQKRAPQKTPSVRLLRRKPRAAAPSFPSAQRSSFCRCLAPRTSSQCECRRKATTPA